MPKQASACERIYGFLPMSTHVVMRPDRVDASSFVDASPQRAGLPSAYKLYLRTAGDPAYRADYEDMQALLRPIFITSALPDDMLADDGFHGAGRVLLSSASSKTAIGLAHLLHARSKVAVTALTSAANRALVAGLGYHDSVLKYDEVSHLPAEDTVYIDFAGSAPVRQAVHEHLADKLVFSSIVGLAHRDLAPVQRTLPGATPILFFAPDRLRKRSKDWGRDRLGERLTAQWIDFVPTAGRWLSVWREDGPDAVGALTPRRSQDASGRHRGRCCACGPRKPLAGLRARRQRCARMLFASSMSASAPLPATALPRCSRARAWSPLRCSAMPRWRWNSGASGAPFTARSSTATASS